MPRSRKMQVNCAAAGFCVAAGFFFNRSGHPRAMAVSESDGHWARAVATAEPANAPKNPIATLFSVTCTARGACVAAGSYLDRSGHSQAMIVTESHHRWNKAVTIAMPPDASADPVAGLDSVACRRTGYCVAVGSYLSRARHEQSIRVTEAAGRWRRAVKVGLPASHSTSHPDSRLNAVACPPGRSCIAVGGYLDNAGHQQAMAATVPAP
jgi:hypothetical protein